VAVWHLITGEYPPQPGGVSDYSRLVACGLVAAGDEVHVWAPECPALLQSDDGVVVHRLPGHFGPRALTALARSIDGSGQSRVLVQYVPHAFGFKAMNLPFCLWLFGRRHSGTAVMFHEVMFPMRVSQPLKHNVIGLTTRLMAMLVARSAERIFVATPLWDGLLRRFIGSHNSISWLPVPSNIPVVDDSAGVAATRLAYSPNGAPLLGHFGTHSGLVGRSVEDLVAPVMESRNDARILLIGANSTNFRDRWVAAHPGLANRVYATGVLAPERLSLALGACDLMIQPYPDGVSTRRTSVMATLAHGRAVVTTNGIATEPLWAESGAVAMAAVDDHDAMLSVIARMLADDDERLRTASAAKKLYAQRFALRHTISALRSVECASV
jgi:glycosyltransferase involved in cell wall biosynthesis